MAGTKTENRPAFEQAKERRAGDMRDVLGLGSDAVVHAEDVPEVRIWKIAGKGDRSRAGWTDTAATDIQRREGRPMRRTPTAVSGVWLFLLSCLGRRNGLLAISFQRRK